MRIFVFEYLTGGGLLSGDGSLAGSVSLAREGAAMVTALAVDFARIPGVEVVILCDPRAESSSFDRVETRVVRTVDERDSAFAAEVAASDATVLIAPECDGILLGCVEGVLRCGGKLLGPGPQLVALAADKHATAEYLARAGVPVPRGVVLGPRGNWPTNLSFPVVIKPRDGAGSQDLRLLRPPLDADNWPPDHERWRIEEFRPGLAASVAVLCGPAGHVVLHPCTQKLASDDTFKYRGGALLLDEKLSPRANQLAAKTVALLPESCGYLGIDMVLGNSQDGSDDAVIEINPRLTTSYVGLRAATRDNLAEAMLAVAAGELPTLSWVSDALEFSADGAVTRSVSTARR